MKKINFFQFQKKSSSALQKLLIMTLLVFLTQSVAAQYFTKVSTGTLVETPIRTYSASFADYNNDGFDDVLIVGNIEFPTTLFANNGDGTFTAKTDNIIYTTTGSSIACTWGDYNNDGNIDLYICNSGSGEQSKNYLYRNDGNGVFTRILEGDIVADQDWSLGAAWADYDNDGFLDLYVANFLQPNRLYHNNGDGTFTKITEGAIVTDDFNSYSASWVDYDNDGFQDMYVVNYFNNSLPGQNNCLYRNNGDGTFTKNTTSLIANDASASQGGSWGDYNNDGLMDLFMTVNDFADIKHNFLYKNLGNGNFEVLNASPSIDGGAGFGSAWLDMNNDGFLDLTVSNNGSSQKRLNKLYLNNGDETFTNQAADDVTLTPLRDYCSTVSDYNNDGYPDIFTPSYSTTLVHGLYKNNGGPNNWISLRLEGVESNRSGIGAKIFCYANGKVQTRHVSSTSGEYTGSTLVQTFGIGTATVIDRIEIFWPSGIRQVITNPATNQIYNILEAATLGTNENTPVKSLTIYPNPAKSDGNIYIKSMKNGNFDLTVTNYVGQRIKSLKVNLESGKSKLVDLGSLEPGVYIISASNKEDQISQKLIITK